MQMDIKYGQNISIRGWFVWKENIAQSVENRFLFFLEGRSDIYCQISHFILAKKKMTINDLYQTYLT